MSSGPTLKHFRYGTDRVTPPSTTLERLRPLLSGFGITRIADVTGMDSIGIDTVMVVRPNSRSVSVSQGKGADLAAAKVSGIMESLEQFHAEHVTAPVLFLSFDELRGRAPVIDVERLPRFTKRFTPQQRMLWIEGYELGTRCPAWVPLEAVHLDLRLPLPPASGYFLSGSNGLASGNHELEAQSHGLCELIERDALALFFQLPVEEQRRKRLALSTVDDALSCALLEKYRRAQIDLAVWDVTSDLGIPCFLCWILESKDDTFRPVGLAQGSGCHPTRNLALSRALAEAAQSRLTRIVGCRDDIQPAHLEELRDPQMLAQHRAQIACGEQERAFGDVPSFEHDSFEEDLRLMRRRLASAGLPEPVVVDLSRAELPFQVLRVLAPGLEGPSYLPGYLAGSRAAAQRRKRTEHAR